MLVLHIFTQIFQNRFLIIKSSRITTRVSNRLDQGQAKEKYQPHEGLIWVWVKTVLEKNVAKEINREVLA